MSRQIKPLFVLFALLFTGSRLFALSQSLSSLVAEKKIIMPANLSAAYPDAEAVIILDERTIEQPRIIYPVNFSEHVVVQILKESAIEKFRTVKIPYFREASVTDIKAQIINDAQVTEVRDIPSREVDLAGADKDFEFPIAQGNNIFSLRPIEIADDPTSTDLLKLTENDIFHKKKAESWKIREITFPDLKVGSIIEYEYRIEDKRIILYDRYYFQRQYPALKLKYTALNALMMRFAYPVNSFARKPETVFESRFDNIEDNYNMRVRNGLRTVDLNQPDNYQFFGHKYFELSLDTMPAFPAHVPFLPPFADMAPRLDMFLRESIALWQKSDVDYRVRRENFSPNWNFPMYRITMNSLVKEGTSRAAKEKIGQVIASASSPEEKVSAAVAWVRENLKDNGEMKRWDGYFWGASPMAPDDLLRKGQGNADDITHFLVSALNLNDLYVYPMYTKGRHRGKFLPNVTIETQFDASMVALETTSRKFRFWQPSTDVPLPADYLDCDYEGVNGIVNQSGEKDITIQNAQLPVSNAEQNVFQVQGNLSLNADGSASGKLQQELTGHFNARMRRLLDPVAETGRAALWPELIAGTFGELKVQGALQADDTKKIGDKFTASAEVRLTGIASPGEGGLKLNSTILGDLYTAQLKGQEREYDVVFPHTADFQTSLEITLPAGYAMPDSLPAPVELKTRGVYYNRVLAKQGPNTLLVKREFSMGLLDIEAGNYNRRFASVFQQIADTDSWTLLLKKQ